MAKMKFANNANTTLASSLTAVATSMSVISASAFPVLAGTDYFYCTLTDVATNLVIEIIKVTVTTGTTWTITRGQDGTTGTSFAAGDTVSLRLVRASLDDFPKLDEDNTFTGVLTASGGLTTAGNTILGNASTDTLNVGNGNLIKDSLGNVGIGTTNPAISGSFFTILNVKGVANNTALITATSNDLGSSVGLYSGASSADSPAIIYQKSLRFGATTNTGLSGFTERMNLSAAGIVTMPAYGAGAATFSAAGVISSVSDETWKIKDGVPLNPDEMLQKLEPGYWYYNEEKAPIFGADRQLGFYAQNVNQAIGVEAAPIPEEGKPWGYYDRSVLAVTVMSLQKALATIENLTARLELLEQK